MPTDEERLDKVKYHSRGPTGYDVEVTGSPDERGESPPQLVRPESTRIIICSGFRRKDGLRGGSSLQFVFERDENDCPLRWIDAFFTREHGQDYLLLSASGQLELRPKSSNQVLARLCHG